MQYVCFSGPAVHPQEVLKFLTGQEAPHILCFTQGEELFFRDLGYRNTSLIKGPSYIDPSFKDHLAEKSRELFSFSEQHSSSPLLQLAPFPIRNSLLSPFVKEYYRLFKLHEFLKEKKYSVTFVSAAYPKFKYGNISVEPYLQKNDVSLNLKKCLFGLFNYAQLFLYFIVKFGSPKTKVTGEKIIIGQYPENISFKEGKGDYRIFREFQISTVFQFAYWSHLELGGDIFNVSKLVSFFKSTFIESQAFFNLNGYFNYSAWKKTKIYQRELHKISKNLLKSEDLYFLTAGFDIKYNSFLPIVQNAILFSHVVKNFLLENKTVTHIIYYFEGQAWERMLHFQCNKLVEFIPIIHSTLRKSYHHYYIHDGDYKLKGEYLGPRKLYIPGEYAKEISHYNSQLELVLAGSPSYHPVEKNEAKKILSLKTIGIILTMDMEESIELINSLKTILEPQKKNIQLKLSFHPQFSESQKNFLKGILLDFDLEVVNLHDCLEVSDLFIIGSTASFLDTLTLNKPTFVWKDEQHLYESSLSCLKDYPFIFSNGLEFQSLLKQVEDIDIDNLNQKFRQQFIGNGARMCMKLLENV